MTERSPRPRYHRLAGGVDNQLGERAIHVVLFLLAFMLRVSTIEAQGVWRDEVDQWRFAFQSLSELLGNFSRPGWNGPLYSPLLRGWMMAAGQSVFAMRLLSTYWGVLGIALACVLARRLVSRRTSLLVGLFLALSPYLIWYAQEIKMYTWVPMLVLLALYALERACQRSSVVWWLVVFAAATLAVYSHILAALLIPVLVLWFVLHPARDARAWLGGGLVLGALTLPYLPLLAWQWPLLWQIRETGYPDFTLTQMISALLNGWTAGISQGDWGRPSVLLATSLLGGSLAAVGTIRTARQRGWQRATQILLWLILPLLFVWAVSQRGPIFTDRYLIWTLPAYGILVVGGVVAVYRLFRPAGTLVVAILATLALHGWLVQATVPIKPQFHIAVEVVEALRQDRDLLVFQIPYNHHVYDFYATDGLGAWREGPYTNWRQPDGSYRVSAESVGRDMRGLVAGYDRVWFVYSEAQLWDDRDLAREWLNRNYTLSKTFPHHGVTVYLFVRPRH